MARFTHPESSAVDLDLTSHLQGVALRGWQAALPYRSEDELRRQFNPDDPEHLERVRDIYRQHAEVGGLVLAYSVGTSHPIGFALASEDNSYVWLRHVCIDNDYQRNGYGPLLVASALELFSPKQVPTAYVFEENVAALCLSHKLGFRQSPRSQQPRIINDFFGAEYAPVEQYRFAADSVESVIQKSRGW